MLSSVFISLLSGPTSEGKELCPWTTVSPTSKVWLASKKESCRSLFVLGWEGLLVNKYILIMRERIDMQMKGTIDKPRMAEPAPPTPPPHTAVVLPGEARAMPGHLLGVF